MLLLGRSSPRVYWASHGAPLHRPWCRGRRNKRRKNLESTKRAVTPRRLSSLLLSQRACGGAGLGELSRERLPWGSALLTQAWPAGWRLALLGCLCGVPVGCHDAGPGIQGGQRNRLVLDVWDAPVSPGFLLCQPPLFQSRERALWTDWDPLSRGHQLRPSHPANTAFGSKTGTRLVLMED